MDIKFHAPNPGIDEKVQLLLDLAGIHSNRDIVYELVLAGLKAGQDAENRGDLRMMNMTLKEMRYTTKIFGPYRNRLKVTIFGSARIPSNTPLCHLAELFGKKLAENGFMVITGGGPGIMGAANKGAGPESSFGAVITLPFEQMINETMVDNPRMIRYQYFFTRKVAFIKAANALALFPGGFGTIDEAAEVLTLLQTGKLNPMPLVLIETEQDDYWERWLEFMDRDLVRKGFISQEDLKLQTLVKDESQAVEVIKYFYRNYHSMRYADNLAVIRLRFKLNDYALRQLTQDFSDCLLPGGAFEMRSALPEESNELDLLTMPRLVFPFNRKSFVRLKEIIDCVNSFENPT